jgi:hypothetical protein
LWKGQEGPEKENLARIRNQIRSVLSENGPKKEKKEKKEKKKG